MIPYDVCSEAIANVVAFRGRAVTVILIEERGLPGVR
jgi:hypothetical protein